MHHAGFSKMDLITIPLQINFGLSDSEILLIIFTIIAVIFILGMLFVPNSEFDQNQEDVAEAPSGNKLVKFLKSFFPFERKLKRLEYIFRFAIVMVLMFICNIADDFCFATIITLLWLIPLFFIAVSRMKDIIWKSYLLVKLYILAFFIIIVWAFSDVGSQSSVVLYHISSFLNQHLGKNTLGFLSLFIILVNLYLIIMPSKSGSGNGDLPQDSSLSKTEKISGKVNLKKDSDVDR